MKSKIDAQHKIERAKPFLRWAGGKSKFVQEIISRLPELPHGKTYYEPFLGAGSVFFAYAPKKAILSDLNPHLILTYRSVRNYASDLVKKLHTMRRHDSEDYYYRVRVCK